ncbi:CgeB family protein [Niallia nealsonii]|uniref:Peptigoglycan-binding protein LysM n=1 Tax=Niallia nealsonii TaxID=115979 RepID=A0A2N0YWY1_9BACI|nr:glycosyltransferase [Niallia nealsonii]PKG21760.1 peptigoglycan-binding protein LysM [Niallia nealsonii]
MRILFIDSNELLMYGLANGFREAGHEVRVSGKINEKTIPSLISSFQPHLIFTEGWGEENDAPWKQELICKQVKDSGIPHIYWAVEDPHFTLNFTLPLIARMKPDFVFTLSSSLVDFYKKLNIRAAHLDFGYEPSIHHPTSVTQYDYSIAVVANAYPKVLTESPEHFRNNSLHALIKPLVKKNIRIDFWGQHWDKMGEVLGVDIPQNWIHGYLPYKDAYKVYNEAKIIIGPQNYKSQVTQRTYEILGSGGFLLTSDTPAVRELFKPGKDLIVSSSKEETLRLVDYYLNHPEERTKISLQGHKSVSKHSYRKRAKQVIQTLFDEGIIEME